MTRQESIEYVLGLYQANGDREKLETMVGHAYDLGRDQGGPAEAMTANAVLDDLRRRIARAFIETEKVLG